MALFGAMAMAGCGEDEGELLPPCWWCYSLQCRAYGWKDWPKLDPYFGFGLGFKSSTWKLDTNDDFFNGVTFKGVPVSMEAKFGVRYFFVPALGAFAELGIGHGFANVGLVGKF